MKKVLAFSLVISFVFLFSSWAGAGLKVGIYSTDNGEINAGQWQDVFAADGQNPGQQGNYIEAWEQTGQWSIQLYQLERAQDTGCNAYRYYRDADGDRCGDPDENKSVWDVWATVPPAGYVANSADDDDSDATSPGENLCAGVPDIEPEDQPVWESPYGGGPQSVECPGTMGLLVLSKDGDWSDGNDVDDIKIEMTGTNYNVTLDEQNNVMRFDLTASGITEDDFIVQVRARFEDQFSLSSVNGYAAIGGVLDDITMKVVKTECDINADGRCNHVDKALLGDGRWGVLSCRDIFESYACDIDLNRICDGTDGIMFDRAYEGERIPVITGVEPTQTDASGAFVRGSDIIVKGLNFGNRRAGGQVRIGTLKEAQSRKGGLGKELTRKARFVEWGNSEITTKLLVRKRWGCRLLEKYVWVEKNGVKSNPSAPFTIAPKDTEIDDCPCTDSDGDNYYREGGVCGPADCDDGKAAVNPGATEECDDGRDNDCDKLKDCDDPDCALACP